MFPARSSFHAKAYEYSLPASILTSCSSLIVQPLLPLIALSASEKLLYLALNFPLLSSTSIAIELLYSMKLLKELTLKLTSLFPKLCFVISSVLPSEWICTICVKTVNPSTVGMVTSTPPFSISLLTESSFSSSFCSVPSLVTVIFALGEMEYSMESTLFLVCSIASIFTAGMSSIDTTSPSKNVNFEAARSFCTSIALLSHAKLAAPLGAVIPSAAVTGAESPVTSALTVTSLSTTPGTTL